ncbi:MAG: alpha/beta hydrolase [Gemmatimonas sp.]|jgi:phospholipase/carboxylesterase|uniref:alpha/beta hydrolase n=1 Tax=Gemmatimonas sp. TaxID=1962908 RepID=UPI00391EF79A|nr:alpha/beta hydrolase [Gemmatimonadota bacterium]
MTTLINDFTHVAHRAQGVDTTLLLLHGTGGDEHDLLPLGQQLLPGAALLSPRGQVLERGLPRFFKRHAEGVLDLHDLAERTQGLSRWVPAALTHHALPAGEVMAVGFSNGANIAASMLLRGTGVLHGAVLFSPMLPFEPDAVAELAGIRVFIGAGRLDPLVPAAQVERLAERLRQGGADVTVHWTAGGHAITPEEVAAAKHWVAAGRPTAA